MKPLKIRNLVAFMLLTLTAFSCASSEKAIYFGGINNAVFESKLQDLEPVIQPNDLLSVFVSSINPEAAEIFNVAAISQVRTASATNTISQSPGYLVGPDGYVELPVLGKFKAAGMTKKAFQESVRQEIINRRLLKEPIVDIRYLNYKVSVLGEVARPSVLTVPNEKITILEALGLAGDLTIFASRDNVLLIREEEGKKKLVRLDLTTNEIFTSPYYYLKSSDIIYVEPNKTKIAASGAARQWLPLVLSSLTLVVVSIDRLTR